MSRFLQLLTLAAVLAVPHAPVAAQAVGEAAPSEEEGQTTISVGSAERQVLTGDGDLMIYLRVQELELNIDELVLVVQVEDLPQLNGLLSQFGSQSQGGGSGSGAASPAENSQNQSAIFGEPPNGIGPAFGRFTGLPTGVPWS